MEQGDRAELRRVPDLAATGRELESPTKTTYIHVALLTAGRDKPYALGLAEALLAQEIGVDFIGSDEVSSPRLMNDPGVRFLNLRGDQRIEAPFFEKLSRVLKYYARLISYAATARPKVFHILWNNKFELFDRTVLMLYYRVLGKRIVFTAHNVNAGTRDANDTWLNRTSLRIQYGLCDHIFVHTERMKQELLEGFGVAQSRVTVIPFGINNTVPLTDLSTIEAKIRLNLGKTDKVLLFFGNIAPYKGLEYLVAAFIQLAKTDSEYRLIIVGRPKGAAEYWRGIEEALAASGLGSRVVQRIEYVSDEETELYFKAADLLILPYTHIFQSGVLLLGYSFGLPVIATDVGSLKDDILEGETGYICRPGDPGNLAQSIEKFFSGHLYFDPGKTRQRIQTFANDRYSWLKVARMTAVIYSNLRTR
jgi:glycosyltransferase involved in cell wall biosynthesis